MPPIQAQEILVSALVDETPVDEILKPLVEHSSIVMPGEANGCEELQIIVEEEEIPVKPLPEKKKLTIEIPGSDEEEKKECEY